MMSRSQRTAMYTPEIEPLLYRRRDAAKALGVSESMCIKLERQGLLTPLRVEAVGRSVRYDPAEVKALAQQFLDKAKRQ